MAKYYIRSRSDGSRAVQAVLGDPSTGVLSFYGKAKEKGEVPEIVEELAKKVAQARKGNRLA